MAGALSSFSLYQAGHPSRDSAVEAMIVRLRELQQETAEPRFSFLGDALVFGELPVHELSDWPWTRRLARAGIQRLELDSAAGREGLERFLDDAALRLAGDRGMGRRADAEPTSEAAGVRWGAVGIREDTIVSPSAPHEDGGAPYRLSEEAEIVRWLHQHAADTGEVPREEVEAVVASLAVALQGGRQFLEPLLAERGLDAYGAVHALNVSTLAMSLAERLGLGSADVLGVGAAALLADIGMARVPAELLRKPALTAAERAVVERHTTVGAEMLLARRGDFDLAAIVAFEHHLQPDGGGYPRVPHGYQPHYISRLVRVCDVYDALRSATPSRAAMTQDEALAELERGAGTAWEAGAARGLVGMMRGEVGPGSSVQGPG